MRALFLAVALLAGCTGRQGLERTGCTSRRPVDVCKCTMEEAWAAAVDRYGDYDNIPPEVRERIDSRYLDCIRREASR